MCHEQAEADTLAHGNECRIRAERPCGGIATRARSGRNDAIGLTRLCFVGYEEKTKPAVNSPRSQKDCAIRGPEFIPPRIALSNCPLPIGKDPAAGARSWQDSAAASSARANALPRAQLLNEGALHFERRRVGGTKRRNGKGALQREGCVCVRGRQLR